ncbi:glycine--tRNA ligase subunit beta [Sphingomonas piscis]|uniref:Glycine--tRNA ligase beta subunit n=1 Tax=Sphingomonas piscis TaxID=2714943 RepID=A0A6G7YLU6_9SPHN|nr:glycine--tRNA ligase subunit beta [Sphingomonas piscis]QIK77720.1 glycine--tRNA ligase subunit beta [Sphingomonas piscis]
MADFLLELLSEEIPARMQAKARNDLSRMFAEGLDAAGLDHGAIDAFSTPRRLVLIAREIAEHTEAVREELKGPRTSAPPQALEGFLRKTGLSQDQLEERGGVWFAVIDKPGQDASAVIQDVLGRVLADFPWPKSMRWGSGGTRWVRPLQGIVAILGDEVIPLEFAGVASSATTTGHRFHHPGPITVDGASDYIEKLRACHVIVDHEERERIVREGAAAAAEAAGLRLLDDEGLVVENAGLTEWPVPLLGRFDPEFLDVPREVIVLTMRTNQKYFACTHADGGLAPAFVCTANIDATDGGERIVEGNRRVLAARLSDARFFWEQDLKVPLEEQAKKLSQIVFHEKLGTVADKVERVAKLARWLVEQGVVRGADPDQAERAARLAKADLVTGMVGEFPELQGIIGGYLARAQGEPNAVADAVRDHYKPVGQGDEVPTAPVTVAVSLADKLDTVFNFFAADMRPTGSKDPFALRRAMLGAISLVLENNLRLKPVGLYGDLHGSNLSEVLSGGHLGMFIAERLKVQQRDAGVRHDIIDAIFATGSDNGATVDANDDLVELLARVKALQAFVETAEGRDLHAAYKRAANILKKEDWTGPQVMSSREEQGIAQTGEEDPLVLVEEPGMAEAIGEMASGHAGADLPEEQALLAALDASEPEARDAVEREDFTAAMTALAKLRGPIDAFFDKVTVNDTDAAKRERRLNLLLRFRDAVNGVADFSKIEG